MARNQRIFYACQAVAIVPTMGASVTAGHVVKGAQSVGMTSTFTLEQVFELGQLEIYENIEEVADIEVTIEKVIDGEALMFRLASNNLCATNLVAAVKNRCDVYVAIYDDATNNATGTPRNVCYNSGMYISSISYNYSVDGNATESITLVGNDRFWNATTAGVIGSTPASLFGSLATGFNTEDAAVNGSGVVRRADVDLEASTLPTLVTRNGGDDPAGLGGNYHVQSIAVSADFGQEAIQELGRFGPYHRYATFPVEVTCEFEVIATSGDLISVSGNAPNLGNETILIKDTAGTVIDLGAKNKLTSVNYTGGDTGGGNSTVTYSFSNYNSLTVQGGGVIS